MQLTQLYEAAELETYKGWSFPSVATIKEDFEEYQKKQSKWQNRAGIIQSRCPMFNDLADFRDCLEKAEVKEIGKDFANKVNNMSLYKNISSLKSLVQTYLKPRDVDRIVDGFENGDKIPMPIIIKGKKGYWIMSGNTRSNAAFILGYKVKVLIIDLSEVNQNDSETNV